MTNQERAARDTWAAHLRWEREGNWRTEPEDRIGFPRVQWDQWAAGDRMEGEDHTHPRAPYWERMDAWFKASQAVWDNDPAGWKQSGVGRWGAFDGAYHDTLLWMEKHDKLAWLRFNRALVEQKVAPGRGLGGPFFPVDWWCEFDHVHDSNGIPTGQREYRLTIPEDRLPARLDERMVLLTLTRIKGATARWMHRRQFGRTDEDFLMDVAHEIGTVGGASIPWEGEWIRLTANGRGQEDHGYGKLCAIKWGPYTDEKKMKERKIVALARRLFKVPTLFAAGVDENTGQAAFF